MRRKKFLWQVPIDRASNERAETIALCAFAIAMVFCLGVIGYVLWTHSPMSLDTAR